MQVRATGGKVVLTVENDGADGEGADGEGSRAVAGADGGGSGGLGSAGPGLTGPGLTGPGSVGGGPVGGGSGLAGLAERLGKVGGTLEAGIAGAGVFRVVAEVPLVVEDSVASEVLS